MFREPHNRSQNANRPVRAEIVPPPGGRFYDMGYSNGFAVSPDGANVAYLATVERRGLWVRILPAANHATLLAASQDGA